MGGWCGVGRRVLLGNGNIVEFVIDFALCLFARLTLSLLVISSPIITILYYIYFLINVMHKITKE